MLAPTCKGPLRATRGSVNLTSVVGSSTPVIATNGASTVNVQKLNAYVLVILRPYPAYAMLIFFSFSGTEGATAIKSATVDTAVTGKNFAGKVTITKNGDPNPS